MKIVQQGTPLANFISTTQNENKRQVQGHKIKKNASERIRNRCYLCGVVFESYLVSTLKSLMVHKVVSGRSGTWMPRSQQLANGLMSSSFDVP